MNSTLIAYDLRRLLPWWLLSLAILGYLFVFLPGPLRSSESLSISSITSRILVGLLFGGMVATRLSADTGGTQSFVFSRGLPRRTIFLNRISLAFIVVCVTSALLWILLWLPVRSTIHNAMSMDDAVYYPAISQFEPPVAIHFGLASIVAVCALFYLQTIRSVLNPASTSSSAGLVKLWFVEIPLLLIATAMIVPAALGVMPLTYFPIAIAFITVLAASVTYRVSASIEIHE